MRRALAGAVAALLIAGCATPGSVRRLRAEVAALRAEAASLRQLEEQTARDAATSAADVRAFEARLNELNTNVGAATGELGRLRPRVEAVEESVKQARATLDALPPPPPAAQPPARESAARPGGPDAAYASALATFRAREYGQAVLDFLDFMSRYPKHPLAGNAQFWIGESYFVQRDYAQALVEYQKVLEALPMSIKVPDALLRIGQCHAGLKEPSRARAAWLRLIQEHPRSEAAARAQPLLKATRPAKGG